MPRHAIMILLHRSACPEHFIRRALLLALVIGFFSIAANAQYSASSNAPGSKQRDDPETENAPNRFERPFLENKLINSYYLARAREPDSHTVFYPPTPPPLESELPFLGPASGGNAPAEVAPFVTDWFYPLLARRLSRNELTDNVCRELGSYLTTRTSLQNDLRAKVAELKGTPLDEHNQAWSRFVETQTPSLLALEEQAEKIAALLRRTDIFGYPADYPGEPGKNLPLAKQSNDARLEAGTLRAAAFFEEGFSAAQRRLLIAAAIDLDHDANPNSASARTARHEWLFSLAPEPARIRLTDDLPASLAKKISDYLAEKRSLKAEICDALIGHATDGRAIRKTAITALASAQATRYVALDHAAEDIRHELNALKRPAGPQPAPTLPPDLANRINAYHQRKLEALKTLYALITHPGVSSVSAATTANGRDADPSTTAAASWLQDSSTRTVIRPANLRASTAEFEATQKKLLDELNREQAEIREALAQYFQTTSKPADRKSLDDLLKDFETARHNQEIGDKYRDYQNALLLPGLTPEQRRLLFAAAVDQLALPLPAAENMP